MGNALAGEGELFARLVMRFPWRAWRRIWISSLRRPWRGSASGGGGADSCGASLSPKAAATWPR